MSEVRTGDVRPEGDGIIAIICGGGSFPLAIAEALTAQDRKFVLFPMRGFANPAVERYRHFWIKVGAVGGALKLMRQNGCTDLVMIGSLIRPPLRQIGFDLKTLMLLPRIARAYRGGDDRLLSNVADMFSDEGLKVRGVHELLPELLMPEGPAGSLRPSADDEEDIRIGFEIIRTLGQFDVGQGVVVSGRRVLAIEAAEGTAGMLSHLAELRRNGRIKLAGQAGILVKAPKPKQDRRIDLPAIGPDTIEQAKAAGLKGIAVEAGGTIIADATVIANAADRAGIFLMGVGAGGGTR